MIRRLLAAVLALHAAAAGAASPRDAVRAWRVAHEHDIVRDFSAFVALPNVATSLGDVDANAAYLTHALSERGFAVDLLRATAGTPATVFAVRTVPGARRTVVFYAHYDGQPVGQAGWLTPPFVPTLRTAPPASAPADPAGRLDPDMRLYGRGTGDDKVSIMAMLAALDALKSAGISPRVNIKLLYEGEEEQGSPHFGAIVTANRERLRADLLVMGDGPMHPSGRQQINGGNRGITSFVATIYGPTKPLHDGHYGSWVPSPAVMAADFVMQLRNDDGRINIPGFYDDVAPVTPATRAALAALPPVEDDLKRSLALGRNIGPQRLADGYLAPTLNIRAIHAGDEGPNAANAIATEATVSVDFRLAPGETPARVRTLTEAYLAKQGWTVVHAAPDEALRRAAAKVIRLAWDAGGSVATMTPLDTSAALAVAASISRTTGTPVLRLPIVGASSGFAEVVDALHVPMVGVSIANYDDNQHARNENVRLGNLWDGIEVYAGLVADLDW